MIYVNYIICEAICYVRTKIGTAVGFGSETIDQETDIEVAL
jgi:hypothetical protein